MLKPELETLFPDNNIHYNIYNEEFVELTDFLCEYFYAEQNLKGSINKCYLRKARDSTNRSSSGCMLLCCRR